MPFNFNNLTEYYALEETGTSATRVGSKGAGANDLTPTNSVSGVSGRIGNAASFSGTSLLSRASTAALTANGNVLFSVAFWMFLVGSGTQGLVWKGNSVGVISDYGWRLNTSGSNILFAMTDGVTNQGVVTTAATWATSTITFIAAWYDLTNLYCSINNAAPTVTAYTFGCWNDGHNFALGASGNGGSIISNGSWLDEVSIWNGYAFTTADVTQLYNNGAGYGYNSILNTGKSRFFFLS